MDQKYLSATEYTFFVADEDGNLKGYISGEIKEKKHRVFSKEGYIEARFVEEDYRNQEAISIYEHLGFTKRLITFFKPL